MINLRKLFQPNPCLLPVSKAEKEILECFISHQNAYEQWLLLHPQPRIRFRFYFPTAVDFYFDDWKLFTAFFRKDTLNNLYLHELKMSRENHEALRTASWEPFKEVMVSFIHSLEETSKVNRLQKTKALHEYAFLCKNVSPESKRPGLFDQKLETSAAAG